MSGITIRNLDPAIKERLRVRHNQGLRGQAMIRKGECLMLEPGVAGEVCFVNHLFRLAAGSAATGRARYVADRLMQQSRRMSV